MPYDDSPVRIAQYDLRPHVNQFVDEKQAALKHLLMYQHTAFGLSRHDQHHAQQVRCQSGPRGIGYGHDGTVKE